MSATPFLGLLLNALGAVCVVAMSDSHVAVHPGDVTGRLEELLPTEDCLDILFKTDIRLPDGDSRARRIMCTLSARDLESDQTVRLIEAFFTLASRWEEEAQAESDPFVMASMQSTSDAARNWATMLRERQRLQEVIHALHVATNVHVIISHPLMRSATMFIPEYGEMAGLVADLLPLNTSSIPGDLKRRDHLQFAVVDRPERLHAGEALTWELQIHFLQDLAPAVVLVVENISFNDPPTHNIGDATNRYLRWAPEAIAVLPADNAHYRYDLQGHVCERVSERIWRWIQQTPMRSLWIKDRPPWSPASP